MSARQWVKDLRRCPTRYSESHGRTIRGWAAWFRYERYKRLGPIHATTTSTSTSFDTLRHSGSIHHGVTLGDGQPVFFHDEGHWTRLIQGLSDKVVPRDGIVCPVYSMHDLFHALVKTPQSNRYRGIQHWRSGYANGLRQWLTGRYDSAHRLLLTMWGF